MILRRLLPVAVLLASACRGQVSDQPPVHIIPDMDWQPKYDTQGENPFFADHRDARTPPEGTVARGSLHANEAFDQGKVADSFVNKVPIEVDEKLLRRGQQRFNIYCAPCHDSTGGGNGLVIQHGYPKPPLLSADHALGLPDGEIFDIITHGVRNMPPYGPQVPEKDRWAIVSWVRVLQRNQHATLADVPSEEQKHLDDQELGQ